ncbi:chemotaxis protein CheW, partial [Vibrio sp. 506]|nr:chemotaxis protein CheW [Vibrio sp. 506]
MSSNSVLSSEQALDDYFSALLGEEVEVTDLEHELDLLAQELSSAEPEPEPEPEPELQMQYAESDSYQFRENYAPQL